LDGIGERFHSEQYKTKPDQSTRRDLRTVVIDYSVHTVDPLKDHAEPSLEPGVIAAKGVIEIVHATAHANIAKHLQIKLEDVHAKTRLAEQPGKICGAIQAAVNTTVTERWQEDCIIGVQATDRTRLSRVDGADPVLQRLEHGSFIGGVCGFSGEQFLSENQHDQS
jgi:hypothetical protein